MIITSEARPFSNACSQGGEECSRSFVWGSRQNKKAGHASLKLDSYGTLDLVDWNNLVIKNLYKGQEQYDSTLVYRASLGTDGIFRLYRKRIGGDDEKSVVLWESSRPRVPFSGLNRSLIILVVIGGLAINAVAIVIVEKEEK
ncbi:hypothetical protein IFM89_032640 [Coptis chinensis]|uniref:Uncharacterized protein n=1 Tax=Coptis chinensis TaxID=261450 RepID=A0A835HL96_9MAGN|nr:hypothetical protein IFM89_032640 [Coptis chinensis]